MCTGVWNFENNRWEMNHDECTDCLSWTLQQRKCPVLTEKATRCHIFERCILSNHFWVTIATFHWLSWNNLSFNQLILRCMPLRKCKPGWTHYSQRYGSEWQELHLRINITGWALLTTIYYIVLWKWCISLVAVWCKAVWTVCAGLCDSCWR